MNKRASHSGFTLIELVITVALVAIIAGIAVASYTQYLTRSRRSDATVALTEMSNLQTRFYANNLVYTTVMAALPYPTSSAGGYYTLSVPAVSANDFTVRATAITSQADADPGCTVLQLNSFGVKTPADCW